MQKRRRCWSFRGLAGCRLSCGRAGVCRIHLRCCATARVTTNPAVLNSCGVPWRESWDTIESLSVPRVPKLPSFVSEPSGGACSRDPQYGAALCSRSEARTVASFDLPAPVQQSVGQCTSTMCIEVRPEVHRPTLFCTNAEGAAKSN